MLKAIEATIDMNGEIRLREPIRLPHSCRAIVTILEAADTSEAPETALLSQESLANDWERPEEDEAWLHLQ